jgi:hypothetical protein
VALFFRYLFDGLLSSEKALRRKRHGFVREGAQLVGDGTIAERVDSEFILRMKTAQRAFYGLKKVRVRAGEWSIEIA